MKKKYRLIIVEFLLLVLIVFLILWRKGVFQKKTENVFGTYVCERSDGSRSVIEITESAISFYNVVFDNEMRICATNIVSDELKEAQEKYSEEFFLERHREILATLDFSSVFNNKTFPVTESYQSDGNHYFTVTSPENDYYRVTLTCLPKQNQLELNSEYYKREKK